MILVGNTVVLGDGTLLRPGYVVVEGQAITAVHQGLPPLPLYNNGPITTSDSSFSSTSTISEVYSAEIVCPGFIDIHTHGIGGSTELLEYWLHDYTFKKLPEYGCTSVLATITFPQDYTVTQQVIKVLRERVDVVLEGQTVLAGIHAEGPIISDCGGLPHTHAPSMTVGVFEQILQKLGPALKIMTISPSAESKCGYERLKALLNHNGAVPALGHDKSASEEDIIGALKLCALHNPTVRPHVTHLFNVSSFNHRLPSIVNFGLIDQFPNDPQYQDLIPPTVEIVGDMVHVSPLTITAALSCRSPEHVAFITDAVVDVSNQSSILYAGNKMSVQTVAPDKKAVVLHGTSTIAGSCTNMYQIFRSLVRLLRIPVEKAVQMLSDTPSKIAKINDRVGSIAVGKRADILLIDSNFELQATIIAGKFAFRK